ncbi:MAG: hypothetical protein AAB434_03275 [Planctomycetota bacterium]
MRFHSLVGAALLAAIVCGCDSGPRTPAVHYVDPDRPVAAVGWSDTDLKKVCDDCFSQLSMHCAVKKPGEKPRVMISRIQNRSNEVVDTLFIGEKIFTAMSATGQFELIDAQAREDIAAEYEYHGSGYVDPAEAKGPGHQTPPDYMLRGELYQITNAAGWSEVKYYNLTMRLTDIEKGTMLGQWQSEIKKVINR